MKNIVDHIIPVISSISISFVILSCDQNTGTEKEIKQPVNPLTKTFTKPASSYNDTLKVNYPAAVFYQPDSIQLSRIKAVEDPGLYESSMHEYYYQMLTARILLKKDWPALTIVESKKYRFLLFIRNNGSRETIDLDTRSDTHGLFVFDGKKSPILVDMTNLETQVSFYLKE